MTELFVIKCVSRLCFPCNWIHCLLTQWQQDSPLSRYQTLQNMLPNCNLVAWHWLAGVGYIPRCKTYCQTAIWFPETGWLQNMLPLHWLPETGWLVGYIPRCKTSCSHCMHAPRAPLQLHYYIVKMHRGAPMHCSDLIACCRNRSCFRLQIHFTVTEF